MDPVEKARRQLGYKNNWHRKHVDEGQQVSWPTPMAKDPLVAIIGGGLSGLMCAKELARLGVRSVVFDTGQHGVGGRMATRASGEKSLARGVLHQPNTPIGGLRFDHAAQFFTVTDPLFQAQVDEWLADGVVKAWEGPVGTLRAQTGQFTTMPAQPVRYVAVQGMRSLAQHVAAGLGAGQGQGNGLVEFRRPCWVGKVQAEAGRGWALSGEGKGQGVYDAVVVAHNGKCANRLVGPTGAPLVAQQLMRLRLNAVWALMVAFEGPVPAPFEGTFIEGSPVLSWAGNNTRKMGLRHTPKELECWTLFSTNEFGQGNKVPQEAIPRDVQEKITNNMLEAFQALLSAAAGRAVAMPRPLFSRTQLWGAALPLNSPGVPCILDPLARVGVCGDWLLGGSLQGAAVSGITLARQLAGLRGRPTDPSELEPFMLGLRQPFRPLAMPTIGEFPN